MLNVSRLSCVRTLLLCLVATMAVPNIKAQESQHPGLDRQLDRVDLAVSGVGIFNRDSNGTAIVNAVPTSVNLSPGNTLGVLATLRYIKSPLLGLELNYGYARYTDTFTPFGSQPFAGVQQNATEYTAGYIAHVRPVFGVKPFASVGLGSIAFRPTTGGGEGLI